MVALQRYSKIRRGDRMIKAVFIDVDNTLLDFQEGAKEAMDKAFEKRGMKRKEGFFEIFKRINDGLWHKIELGELTREGLAKIRFNMIFREAGIYLDGVEFERDFRKNLAESAVKVKNAEEILKYISQKYPIYVTSNAPQGQQLLRLEKAGLLQYITDVFTSERMGFNKPDKRFFDMCFDMIPSVLPEEIMIIGDSINADVRGGIENGLKTCWFNYFGEKAHADITPDHTVESLLEIKEIL